MNDIVNSFFSTLPFTVTLIWTVILFIEYGKSSAANRALAWFALTSCLLYFAQAVHFLTGTPGATIWLDCLYTLCHLAVYPVFYIYIRLLTEPQRLKISELWVIVPAIVVAFAEHAALATESDIRPILIISDIIFPIEIVLTFIFAQRKLARFNKEIENFYANTEEKTARPVQIMMYVVVLTSLASVVSNLIGRDSFMGSTMLAVPSTVLTVLIFLVLYIGYRQRFDARSLQTDFDVEQAGPEEEKSDITQEELFVQINAVMEEKMLFCHPGLKISELTELIGSNRTYVSKCINSIVGQSFSEFINSYRVEYVKQLLDCEKAYTITEIGTMAGFSSDSSLFRNFKKATGMTPAEWQYRSEKAKKAQKDAGTESEKANEGNSRPANAAEKNSKAGKSPSEKEE